MSASGRAGKIDGDAAKVAPLRRIAVA